MKFNLPINNFTAGEWSPKMRSLVSAEEYMRSCKEITNMFVQMQGGAQYRPGTQFLNTDIDFRDVASAFIDGRLDSPEHFKFIPYTSGQGSTTFIVCSDPAAPNVYTFPDCLPITQTGIGLENAIVSGMKASTLQHQQIGDYLFVTSSTGLMEPFVIYYDATADEDYRAVPYTDFMDSTTPFLRSIPLGDVQALGSSVTLTTSGSAASTAVGATFSLTASATFFTSLMTGRYIRLANGTTDDAIVRIGTFTSGTANTVTVIRKIALTNSFAYGSTANASSFWQIDEWSFDLGWPKAVTAFQGRLIWGGTKSKPDTIWGSRISNILDFQEVPDVNTTGVSGYASSAFTADNSRPFALTPNSAEASNIVTLSSGKTLNIHTDQSEIIAYGSNGALGPVNVVFDSSTSFGARPVQPVRVNGYSTFIQANGYKVRDLIYSFNEDQYKSTDLGFLAEHLFIREDATGIDDSALSDAATFFPTDDIIECAKLEARSSFLLVRTRRGRLYYVTLDRDYKVNAWGRIVFGRPGAQTAPYSDDPVPVLGMGIREYSGGKTSIYFALQRTIDGETRVVFEELNPLSIEHNNISGPNETVSPYVTQQQYLDSWRQATAVGSTPTTTWKVSPGSAYPLYPNETLSVVADGSYVGEITLGDDDDGDFTLSNPATYVFVGYKYPGVLETTGLEAGGQIGPSLGRIKRVDEVVTRFYKTGSGKIGRSDDDLEEVTIRRSTALMGQPTPYFTGDKVHTFPPGYERDYSIKVVQDKPYPMYVVSVTARGVTYD